MPLTHTTLSLVKNARNDQMTDQMSDGELGRALIRGEPWAQQATWNRCSPVVRKMAAPAALPLFYKPHIDLTNAVVQTLNTRYPPSTATPAAATRPAGQ